MIDPTAKRINRKELAKLANVTPAVITTVFQQRPSSVRVSREVQEKVLRLAREHNYKADIFAQSLAQQKSFLIGLLFCHGSMAAQMWGISQGMDEVASQRDYSLMLLPSPATIEGERARIQRALDRRVDAIVTAPFLDDDRVTNEAIYRAVEKRGTPVIQVCGSIIPGIPYVMDDGVVGAKAAVEHLIALGHRRILHLTGEDSLDQRAPGSHPTSRMRREGYLQAMNAAGLEPTVLELPHQKGRTVIDIHREFSGSLLKHPYRPTAVFCYNDRRAIGVMNGLQDLGLRIPEEMSIVGYDGSLPSIGTYPPLTTVKMDRRGIGALAVQFAFERMKGGAVEGVVLPPQFIPGGTVAAPRSGSARARRTKA